MNKCLLALLCLVHLAYLRVDAEPFDMTMDRPYQGWPNSLQMYEYPNRLSVKPMVLKRKDSPEICYTASRLAKGLDDKGKTKKQRYW